MIRARQCKGLFLALIFLFFLSCFGGVQANPGDKVSARIKDILSSKKPEGNESFFFCVISDTHVWNGKKWNIAGLEQKVQKWRNLNPALVFVIGDFGYKHVPCEDQYKRFAKTLAADKSSPAIALALGNHEVDSLKGKKGWLNAVYPGILGENAGKCNELLFYYSFDYRGRHFICLDTCRKDGKQKNLDGEISIEQLEWLRQDLKANASKETFVFAHHPALQVNNEMPYSMLKNRGVLLRILAENPQVSYLFSGHLHASQSVIFYSGINIVNCSLRSVWAVKVLGANAVLGTISGDGRFIPCKEKINYDEILKKSLEFKKDLTAYRVSDETFDERSKIDTLRKYLQHIPAQSDIKPTSGSKMIKCQIEKNEAKDISRRLKAHLDSKILQVKEGMVLSYDVFPESNLEPTIRLKLETPESGIKYVSFGAESSKALKTPTWVHRAFNLSQFAGAYITEIQMDLCFPKNNRNPVRFYIDNIALSWPNEGRR